MPILEKTIADLTPDARNANKGTQRGGALLEDSLRKFGAGRSILIDRNGQVIAGNKTLEGAASIGLDNVLVVQSDGTKLVAVQRTDIDLDTPEGRGLAVADNRTSEVGLEWDGEELKSLIEEGLDLSSMFFDNELARILGEVETPDDPREHWDGMSDLGSKPEAFRTINMHFRTEEDVEAFGALIGQSISDDAKYLWHPKK